MRIGIKKINLENQDRLIPIFHKYLNNQCSPDEVAELFEYFRTENNPKLLRSLILAQLSQSTEQPSSKEASDETDFDRVFDSISHQIDLQEPSHSLIGKRLQVWMAIAASFLLISAVLYFQRSNIPSSNSVSKNKTREVDIPPGSNKARLTLANGEVITLNGAKNGTLVKQKDGIVNKTRDGEVVYQSNNPKDISNIVEFNTITTPRGGQYVVILPDGSKVWLNAASSLKFPVAFTHAERHVELTGEGYFEVQKDKTKPFKLSVNGATVEVLGTHFNVMAYNDEAKIRTTLIEGSVKISKGDKSGLLKPGQQADIDKQSNIMINDADTEQALAWKNGYFKFSRDNIQAIMRQLSRWYDIEVVYEGKIPDGEFVGKIRRNANVSEVLRVLELNNIHFKIANKKIMITGLN